MRLFDLDAKLKRGYRASRWYSSLLLAQATGHPSFQFYKQQIEPEAWRLERMTVLPERDVVFLPVPKNANSKTNSLLSEVRGLKNHFAGSNKKFRTCSSASEISIQELHRILNSRNRMIFAIVRDPYERVYSAWANKFRGRPLVPSKAFRKPKPEIDTYLRLRSSIDISLPEGESARIDFDQFLIYVAAIVDSWEDGHVVPQSRFLNVPFAPIDLLIRLESHVEDMKPVMDHIKAPASVVRKLGDKINWSGLAKNEYAVTAEQRKIIERLYREDFEAFGYRRQL
jgi:hypothetical protein